MCVCVCNVQSEMKGGQAHSSNLRCNVFVCVRLPDDTGLYTIVLFLLGTPFLLAAPDHFFKSGFRTILHVISTTLIEMPRPISEVCVACVCVITHVPDRVLLFHSNYLTGTYHT